MELPDTSRRARRGIGAFDGDAPIHAAISLASPPRRLHVPTPPETDPDNTPPYPPSPNIDPDPIPDDPLDDPHGPPEGDPPAAPPPMHAPRTMRR
ncbi:hypothetical protein LJ655_00385 [Paraburkholderia sp. MMS20-SJTN17]|uniref:Uncharacterized protein n=1 Tax=Paraburkholderia translucens TaxID=2886945 RepID=A0ABS8K6J3_9BURK|nr:hypothetical protein [Paraburkholderia sp. MMS20-SJTN17]MCC8400360.1 hypothetical protein [Paraburkholderia sp. MMS20-SJTN17]